MAYTIDIEAENKEITRRYRNLLKCAKPVLKEGDTKVIRKAFETAVEAHKEQRRKTGEPYIYHPIAVAEIAVNEIGLGTTSIVAALLHDVVEDTPTTLEDIEKAFGKKVARIIDGLTKISGVIEHDLSSQAENFRKIVLSLADDVRVILVKLADRLHNMRTLEHMPRHKQLKIASETIYMYAPLAHRLGLYVIKTELEDLYLKYTQPETYYEIARKINETKKERNEFIREFIKPIQEELRKNYLEFVIKGRPKSIYSIWNKMKKQNIPFEEVYDLFAIRVILNAPQKEEKELCWKAYSIVTDFYKPNPDRLRDWISTPRANGYESLHTTVMSSKGKWVEVQIRTERMDEIAEKGYAAHWKYKEKLNEKNSFLDEWISRAREMLEQEGGNSTDFIDNFRLNLYNEEIYVFTPNGDLKILPRGASTLDFAFEVHTMVGLKCLGAKVNNKLVPLSYKLNNGDQVEVLTSPKQKPNEEWLKIVITSKAKKRIKDFLNDGRRNQIQEGREILLDKLESLNIPFTQSTIDRIQSYFKEKDVNDLYLRIAGGKLDISNINNIRDAIKIIKRKKQLDMTAVTDTLDQVKKINSDALVIGEDQDDTTGIKYTLAKCCNPIPGDDVFGFVTVNEGVKIHRTSCVNSAELMSQYGYRIVKARWSEVQSDSFLAGIKITGTDRLGLIKDLTTVIAADEHINIKSMMADTIEGIVEDILMIYVKNKAHLDKVIDKIRQIDGILTIERFEAANNNS